MVEFLGEKTIKALRTGEKCFITDLSVLNRKYNEQFYIRVNDDMLIILLEMESYPVIEITLANTNTATILQVLKVFGFDIEIVNPLTLTKEESAYLRAMIDNGSFRGSYNIKRLRNHPYIFVNNTAIPFTEFLFNKFEPERDYKISDLLKYPVEVV